MTLKSCHIMQQKMKNELVSVHDRSKMVWGKKKKKKDKRDCWCNVISCLFSPCRLNGRSIRKPSSAGVCGPFYWCCAFCRYLFYCDISRNCLCIPLSVRPSVFADIVCDYKRHAYPFEIFQEGGKVRMDTWDLSSCALHCLTFSADHHYTTVRCAVCCLLTWSFSSLNASLLSAVSEASAAYVMYCRTASLCLPAWACRNRVILLGCLLRLGLCVLWNGSDVWRRGGGKKVWTSFL